MVLKIYVVLITFMRLLFFSLRCVLHDVSLLLLTCCGINRLITLHTLPMQFWPAIIELIDCKYDAVFIIFVLINYVCWLKLLLVS